MTMGPLRNLSGIRAKALILDRKRQRVSAAVRMEPGLRYANHRHTRTEKLSAIEAGCYDADCRRSEAGSIHLATYTDQGSLMLVMTSGQNELRV
jgi:anti-sigma factor ChrR (cupin superfamily)